MELVLFHESGQDLVDALTDILLALRGNQVIKRCAFFHDEIAVALALVAVGHVLEE